jgi:hypothetical protein
VKHRFWVGTEADSAAHEADVYEDYQYAKHKPRLSGRHRPVLDSDAAGVSGNLAFSKFSPPRK